MSRFTVIDLSQLPAMEVLEEIDTETIVAQRMQKFVEQWRGHDPPAGAVYDVGGLEFDPIVILQEANTYFELMLRDRVNQAARAVTLAYAIGGDLDAIATRYPGGVPRLPNEADDRYRRRIWLSVNPLSPHGTAEAYQFWALSALDGVLRDASAIKIRPTLIDNPTIIVTCLAAGNDPKPTPEQLIEIRRYITSENRQGMTDDFSVMAPKVKHINYHVKLWFYPGPDARLLMQKVVASVAALIEKQYWLGYDHTRMALHAACALSGVQNAVIVEPENTPVPPDWVVKVDDVKLELVGRAE